MTAPPDPATFLSGESGGVVGVRRTTARTLGDAACALAQAAALTGPRLDRLAARQEPRRILVVSVYRPGSRLPEAIARLESKRHDVRLALGATADEADPRLAGHTVLTGLAGGKFENVNRLLEHAGGAGGHDWLLVVDDDIALPRHFLDRFVAMCECLGLDLAQPAQTQRSHSAWRVTRRRPFSLARRTRYVEIGPLTAFSARCAAELTPFPPLRFGWGLDNHWGAVAGERGWRLGVIDALPVRHEWQRVATNYTHAEAIAEGREFLAGKRYLTRAEAEETLERIGRLP